MRKLKKKNPIVAPRPNFATMSNPYDSGLKSEETVKEGSSNRNRKSNLPTFHFKLIKNNQEVVFSLKGQKARALRSLIENGDKGCTALEISQTFALRLSEYVRALRHDGLAGGYNLRIITKRENNPSGWHGRYSLLDEVIFLGKSSNHNLEVNNG